MRKDRRNCIVEGCESSADARGLCKKHYSRWRRHGDPTASRYRTDSQRLFQETLERATPDHCILWPFSRDGSGYGRIRRDGKERLLHRQMCEDAHGPAPDGSHFALHACGNGHLGCFNPHHLYWGTHKQNMADMIAHGRSTRGELNPSAKLTERAVHEIRALVGSMSQQEIAAQYGVGRKAVYRLVRRETWKHV